MLWVSRTRAKRTSCRLANATLVAIISEGVGPGVKIEVIRSVRKAAIAGVRFGRGKAQVNHSTVGENLGSKLCD